MSAPNCKVTDGLNTESIEPLGRWRTYGGYGVFVTATSGNNTTTNAVVNVPADATILTEVQITAVFATAAQAANGQLTLAGVTVNADGSVTPTTAGVVNVKRIAATDAALGFMFSCKWR